MEGPTISNTIGDVIYRWAEIQPDAPALVSEEKAPLTYRKLTETIDDFRGTLNACGFGRGDRIAIVHPGGADLAVTLLSVISGATAIPLKPDYTAAEFATHFRRRSADGVLISSGIDTPAQGGVGSRASGLRYGFY